MTPASKVLQKNPALEPAQDFYRLRREGIGFIAEMGSRHWTDYNVHDPGITLLEALCYAITDLAYRSSWDIADILTPKARPSDPLQPYPDQAFFTARTILTVNPVTPDDFRRLLIDLDGVRNAWMICKECACDASYWAWCHDNALTLSYVRPANVTPVPVDVTPRGLYEALLELEHDPELGDLNDRKIEQRTVVHDAEGTHAVTFELRFPDPSLMDRDEWTLFLASEGDFDAGAFTITLTRFGATRTFDLFGLGTVAERDSYVRDHWRQVLYASLSIVLTSSGQTIVIENAALRIFSDTAAKNGATAEGLRDRLQDIQAGGFVQRYRKKARKAQAAVQSAKALLHSHRNLDEDYCRVMTAGIEEVAVCADVEVTPDADIEHVQAEIWFRIEQYFNPPILFHDLQERRDAGAAVEDIFDGPELVNGFITNDDLERAALRGVLRGSDILNSLMDIDGVVAINQLLLTKYDSDGNVVAGAADPTWDADGKPIFDPARMSASWLLYLASRHQPRLYLNQSRFLFAKNGLPFLPRMDEASDVLNQLRGDAERPKNPGAPTDIAIPTGTFRDLEGYYPVQNSLPELYGTGRSGLPAHASAIRQAQAKQLKAYLMVFEQLLGNALTQLAHTADLFSLDPAIRRTYFVRLFSEGVIKGFDEIVQPGMTQAALEGMTETPAEFYERRNRFLDHLLARFGEDFGDYALLLSDVAGTAVAQERLIDDKIGFLKRYPRMSHDRGRAFDYTVEPCSDQKRPGLKQRISLLLGYPDLTFTWTPGTVAGGKYPFDFRLRDGNAVDWLRGSITVEANDPAAARRAAFREVVAQMVRDDRWTISGQSGGYHLAFAHAASDLVAEVPRLFDNKAAAVAMQRELTSWSANERLIVVEHLLLRPKFPGDALYPACCDAGCCTCGNEDPYSFRLTIVMPGWLAQYSGDMELRRFADRTVQQETPSHLLPKVCWVGNDGFIKDVCDDVIGDLADLLVSRGTTSANVPPSHDDACACALAVFDVFSDVFTTWYDSRALDFIHQDALAALIAAEFDARIKISDVSCTIVLTPLWAEVQALMTAYFVGIALNGWQFERFERAWCAWLDANAAIDWTEEHLFERVRALLERNLTSPASPAALCGCARTIVTDYGTRFFEWMQKNLTDGRTLGALTPFVSPAVTICPGLSVAPGTAGAILSLLDERYSAYTEVSYRLWVVVLLLSSLRNVYPGATLHDCDDGSDTTAVRLNSTALGNYSRGTRPPEL